MLITIDGKNYNGSLSVIDGNLSVMILADISDAFAWDKALTITADGTEHNVSSLVGIGRYDEQIRVEWELESETADLERQLTKAKAELNISNEKISRVKDAIAALGEGIPTLSKLREFLTAVKEAINATDD